MEDKSMTLKKPFIQLPNIPGRYIKGLKSDFLKGKNSLNQSSISPIPPRSNLVNENPGFSPSRAHGFDIKSDLSIIKEKKLQDIEKELSYQELKYCDLNILTNLEHLFYSYSAYLEGITQCIMSHIYRSSLGRAKNGFIAVFRKVFPKLKQETVQKSDEITQTLMSITPQQDSQILSKLGDIIKEEIAGTEKLEKYIQKNIIVEVKKPKLINSITQTDHRVLPSGVLSYEFRTYDELEQELEKTKKKNRELVRDRKIMEKNCESLDDTERLIYRNKVLESMVVKLRHSALLDSHELSFIEEL